MLAAPASMLVTDFQSALGHCGLWAPPDCVCITPYRCCQRSKVGADTPGTTEISDALALVEELLSSAQLTDDLHGKVTCPIHAASPGRVLPAGKFSSGMVYFGVHDTLQM
jgi:hypothetical protein